MGNTARARLVGGAALLLCIGTIALWWPGIATYDGVAQYQQVLAGVLDDWHPPIMARLWMMLHPLGAGTAPMFVVQVALYWLGFGLIAIVLVRAGKWGGAMALFAIAACPLFLGWQAAVLKDSQMTAALLAAIGLAAWWRLAGRRLPVAAGAAIAVLVAYATMVRGNAVFATIPLAVLLPEGAWSKRARLVTAVVATLFLLGLGAQINHRLLERTQPIFDLAGIAHFAPHAASTGLTAGERALIARRHCYQPFFWDPLGEPDHCGEIADRLNRMKLRPLITDWLGAVLGHPVAYAEHRFTHLNSSYRLFVPVHWPNAAPPVGSEPNDVGLPSPGAAAVKVAQLGVILAETPLGWPIAWIPVTVTALWIAVRRARSPLRNLALALAASAVTLEASFLIISIASDLRYHLWPMIATALAVTLLASERPLPRRPVLACGAALALVIAIGTVGRLSLPPVQGGYREMLG
jgi:hypothetical protein